MLQREMGYPIFIQLEAAMRALAASRERSFHPARLFPLPPPTTRRPHEVDDEIEMEKKREKLLLKLLN